MALNPAIPTFIPGSANASLVACAEKVAELHELQMELLPYFEAPYWGVSTSRPHLFAYLDFYVGLMVAVW
jgi:hypothetical protein